MSIRLKSGLINIDDVPVLKNESRTKKGCKIALLIVVFIIFMFMFHKRNRVYKCDKKVKLDYLVEAMHSSNNDPYYPNVNIKFAKKIIINSGNGKYDVMVNYKNADSSINIPIFTSLDGNDIYELKSTKDKILVLKINANANKYNMDTKSNLIIRDIWGQKIFEYRDLKPNSMFIFDKPR